MGLFHNALGGLDDFPDLNLPEGFGETITGAYDADLAESSSSAMAKITAIQQELEASNALVQELKVQNFDLLMQIGADTGEGGGDGGEAERPGPAETDADLPDTIDGLFEEVDPDDKDGN